MHTKNDHDRNQDSSCRFGGLKTIGPFPVDVKKQEIYFPCPLDLSVADDGALHPMILVPAEKTDLPRPLQLAFSSTKLGKGELPQWLSKKQYDLYLQGKLINPGKAPASCVHGPEPCVAPSSTSSWPHLYDTDRNIGIAIDSETGTAAESKLYQAEYLRFRPDVRMAVRVSCMNVGKGKAETDVFAEIAREAHIPLILGGQQGVATATEVSHGLGLPENLLVPPGKGDTVYLRWTLLSPAVFPEIAADSGKGIVRHPGGWLPTWVEPSLGMVMLPKGDVPRNAGESRDQWRQRVNRAPRFEARLVAARIGKSLAFSGWDLQTGPKPTRLAVPAGSVYVFECKDIAEARFLADVLSWNGGDGGEVRNRRSTLFGEKGVGIGVCSIINQGQS